MREQPLQIRRGGPPKRPTAPGASAGSGGMTGRDVFRILRKRKWMIILTVTLVVAATAVGTWLWWQYAPFYTAEAYLKINPPTSSPFRLGEGSFGPEAERIKLTHVRLIKTEKILNDAISQQAINSSKWYNRDKKNAIRRLYDALDVTPDRTANLILLSMTATAPTEADRQELAEIVSTVGEVYVEDTKTTATSDRQNEINRLNGEREDEQKKLEASRRDSELLRAGMNIPDMYEKRNLLSVRLQTLVREVMQLELSQSQVEAAYEAIVAQRKSGELARSAEVAAGLEMDRELVSLRNQLTIGESSLENALRKYGPSHRIVTTLQQETATVKQRIEVRQTQVVTFQMNALVQQREAAVLAVRARLLEVRKKFNEATGEARDLSKQLTTLEQYESKQRDTSDRIRKIENTLQELRVASKGEEPVRLQRRATPPREIAMPRWSVMIPLGVLAGLVIALGLAFVIELMDTSIKSPADLSRRVDLPLLGMVPHLDDLEEEIEEPALAFKTDPDSLIGEAFRQIRSCLFFSGPADQRRSLLVTSPMPEDGRTTVAVNLAGVMSQGGLRVLLIDANFRQPAVHTLFPESRQGGLSSALVGQSTWQELVQEVEPNLHVIAAGTMPPNPAELLGSEQMGTMIGEMVEQYDQVLIDSPPCMVVTDASVLSSLVDGVVLVVRAGANTYGIVQRARDTFVHVGAHMTGVVLNGMRAMSGGYLRKNYETFYEYRTQEQLPSG